MCPVRNVTYVSGRSLRKSLIRNPRLARVDHGVERVRHDLQSAVDFGIGYGEGRCDPENASHAWKLDNVHAEASAHRRLHDLSAKLEAGRLRLPIRHDLEPEKEAASTYVSDAFELLL